MKYSIEVYVLISLIDGERKVSIHPTIDTAQQAMYKSVAEYHKVPIKDCITDVETTDFQ